MPSFNRPGVSPLALALTGVNPAGLQPAYWQRQAPGSVPFADPPVPYQNGSAEASNLMPDSTVADALSRPAMRPHSPQNHGGATPAARGFELPRPVHSRTLGRYRQVRGSLPGGFEAPMPAGRNTR